MKSINLFTEYQKKNHDVVMRLNKQFADIMRKHRASHSFSQLTISGTHGGSYQHSQNGLGQPRLGGEEEEVWLELIFYRDRKHHDDVMAKMKNDESCGSLFRQFTDLITSGTSCIIGEFSHIKI